MSVSRRGVVLLEVVAACGLMAVLVAVCLQMLAVTAATRRTVERRAIALQEAANLLERASALAWPDITPERLAEIDLGPRCAKSFRGPWLTCRLKRRTSQAHRPNKFASRSPG